MPKPCPLIPAFLALGTEKTAAPGLDQALDGGAAPLAGLAFPAVHLKPHLEQPGLTIAVEVVGHGGPTLADGLPQDAPSLLEDPLPIRQRQAAGGRRRV